MAFFKKLLKKSNNSSKPPRGFHSMKISAVEKLTSDTVKVLLEIPEGKEKEFVFSAGQYLDFSININGTDFRRSYSICSGTNEPLAVAVKQIENGIVSMWFNHAAQEGDTLQVSSPQGNFTIPKEAKNIVAIAAGSGITPIMSIAKEIEKNGGKFKLFYGNRTTETILFKSEIDALTNTTCSYYLSGEEVEGYGKGRINKQNFSEIIKSDLQLLKTDCFFICGPEQMILEISEVLKLFGVSDEKIRYELFTTPVLLKKEDENTESDFSGEASVSVILDSEKITFNLAAKGESVLEKSINEGLDAPYSCKGGVCSSCKAKVLNGKTTMSMNYSLTDQEIEEGYTLTCQTHPASSEILISYDE